MQKKGQISGMTIRAPVGANKMKHGTRENKMKHGSHENGNFLGEINRRFYLCQNEIFQNRSRQQKSDENQKHQSMTAKMKRIKSNGGKD